MTSQLVPAHGGKLMPLLLAGEERQQNLKKATMLPKIRLSSRETSDLIMMASGAFSPLKGFMGKNDYENVVENMHLSNSIFWPIPITLSVTKKQAESLPLESEAALVDDESDETMGVMTIREKFTYDKKNEARKVFCTEDEAHPGVAKLYNQKEILLGGPLKALSEGPYPKIYGKHYARPEETRKIFKKRGWSTVAAFQTRNPIHRSHEYCTKIALEVSDGILIHPLVGKLKAL